MHLRNVLEQRKFFSGSCPCLEAAYYLVCSFFMWIYSLCIYNPHNSYTVKIVMYDYRCRSLMLVGDDSPHMDDVVNMNGRMDPEQTDFMKVLFT